MTTLYILLTQWTTHATWQISGPWQDRQAAEDIRQIQMNHGADRAIIRSVEVPVE